MAENDRELSPRQTQAVSALLSEPSLEAAAKLARISQRTLRRWRAKPEFSAAVRVAGAEAVRDALGRLRTATGDAVETLRQLAASASSESVRCAAAKEILALSLRVAQLDALEERIERLENRIHEAGEKQWQ
jgi:hypothetical protein